MPRSDRSTSLTYSPCEGVTTHWSANTLQNSWISPLLLQQKMANPTALMIQLLEEQLALLKKHMALLRSEGSTHERSGMPQLSHPIAKKGKAVSKTPAPVIQEDSGLPEASQLTLNDTGGAPNRLLPAKAPNAFALYMNQNMLTCKKANPFKKMSQLILILSLSWKDVPSKEKKIFRDQAAALNAARTAELMATTTPELVVEFKNILAKKKIVEEKVEKILDIEEEEDDDAPVILCRNQKVSI